MSRVRLLSNKRGFTLIESLIASLIMAIGLFIVLTAIYLQATILNKNREQTIATLIAQGEIEFLRGQLFSNIVTRHFDEEEAPGLEYLHYGSGYGHGDITVSTTAAHLKNVSVTVTWNSVNGKELKKTAATLMAENGINKQ
jgi:prepilin-type N-terminal cleavage/methylation domain-containing protein